MIVTMAVGIWTQDTGGDGIPLVLIHPGWGDAEIWSPMLPALITRYRVIRYDNRGYGHSPAPAGPFSQVDDLRSVLDRAGVPAAAVVAHSGGGGTALAFALSAPERVSAIVLVAPGAEDYRGRRTTRTWCKAVPCSPRRTATG